MKIAAPDSICRRVSDRAAQYARQDMVARGWSNKSINAITPLPGAEGRVGIKTSAKYLMYQESGIKPFVMYWVEGRRVPIKDKGGSTHVVTGREPGKPGWVTLPGGVRKWRDQKWRHPGLQPKNFMRDALEKAIKEEQHALKDSLMSVLRGEYRE